MRNLQLVTDVEPEASPTKVLFERLSFIQSELLTALEEYERTAGGDAVDAVSMQVDHAVEVCEQAQQGLLYTALMLNEVTWSK